MGKGSAAVARNDLFQLFPDLPKLQARRREVQVARLRALVRAARSRAELSVARQRAAVAVVRACALSRHRRTRLSIAFAACLLVGSACAAQAQDALYVGGLLFADLQRSSGQTSSSVSNGSAKLDGTTLGGGVRVGAFLAPRWSVEVGLDMGARIDQTLTPLIVPLAVTGGLGGELPTAAFFRSQYSEHVSERTSATSVLLAYHPSARRHVRAGLAAGLSFMHTSSSITNTITYTLVGPAVIPVIPTPLSTRIDSVSNQIAPTVGAEAAIEVSRHAAIVPEIRAHGFDSRFVVRPGVGARWQW